MATESIGEELKRAIAERTKHFIFEQLDEGTLRNYLTEMVTKETDDILRSYDLRKAVEDAVDQRLKGMIPQVLNEVLSRESFKKELLALVTSSAKEGIANGARRLKEVLAAAISSR